MYLMIPVLRLFVKREYKKYIVGIITTALIVQFGARTADFFTVNCDTAASGFIAKFYLNPATGFIGYLLLGWYLNEYTLKSSSRKLLYALGLICVVVSTLLVYWKIDEIPQIRDFMYSESSFMAFVYGAALFVLIQDLCCGKLTQSRITAVIADCTFGIYLLHVAILEIFVKCILSYEKFGCVNPLAYILLLYAVTLLVPFAVVKLTGHIKAVRKIFYQ